MIPLNDLKYDVNDAKTANIHVLIPVIGRNYNINIIVTASLMKSREWYLVFQVIHLNYDIKHWFVLWLKLRDMEPLRTTFRLLS